MPQRETGPIGDPTAITIETTIGYMGAIDHQGVIRRFPELEWDDFSGSLILSPERVDEVVSWLKEDPAYRLDYLSCVSGVDYLEKEEKTRVRNEAGKMVVKTSLSPEKMEVVYHFYSMEKKTGPFILKQRVHSRENPVVTSLTPHYRGAELMEREVYDLFGIHFTGHPDLRRILMWEAFQHHPMRKDYVPPNDYEYEPTPHGDVLQRARERREELEGQSP